MPGDVPPPIKTGEDESEKSPFEQMTRVSLFEECDKLGIETKGDENRTLLIDKLKKF
jgi:hypothetical protein